MKTKGFTVFLIVAIPALFVVDVALAWLFGHHYLRLTLGWSPDGAGMVGFFGFAVLAISQGFGIARLSYEVYKW